LADLYIPPPPPCPPWCETDAAEIVAHLLEKQHAQPWQVEFIVGCLSEEYLLSLPKLSKDNHDSHDTSPKRLRWLFYTWAARILGWTKRREEGDDDGFSPDIYRIIREVVFPFPKVERPQFPSLPSSTETITKGSSSLPLRCTPSYTSKSKDTSITEQWTQHFVYEGLIDSDGFIVEDKFENTNSWVKIRLSTLHVCSSTASICCTSLHLHD